MHQTCRPTVHLFLFLFVTLKYTIPSYSWSPAAKRTTNRLMNTNNMSPVSPASTHQQDPQTLSAPHHRQHEHWHVWKTADRLSQNGLASSLPTDETHALTQTVISILHTWGKTWAGAPEWQGVLNKSSLLHEIEESIVALHALLQWMDTDRTVEDEPLTIVDVCCGKGIFSMLASYVFRDDPRIHQIVMLDRASILWNHVEVVNESAVGEGRPRIESWGGCNLHEVDPVITRLENIGTPLALVGIHLCKTLSPTCVGIVNAIGPSRCPFLCLAPCCLPRAVVSQATKYKKNGSPIIEVPQYESPQERDQRFIAAKLRRDAMKRGQPRVCFLCRSPDHPIHGCGMLPVEEGERLEIFRNAAAMAPCWKCGKPGHNRAECPSGQTTRKPSLARPPVVRMDVSKVLDSEVPFDAYCGLLAGTLQRDHVRLMETGLVNDKPMHRDNCMNWNRGRKSVYIVATAQSHL